MSNKPKIVAVNGSPNRHGGNTGQLVRMLENKLVAEGFEMEMISLAEKRIWYCAGCGFCLENEKGNCWIKDDHKKIVKKLLSADGVILASPVYIISVSGQMKVFLDRCLGIGHKPRPTWKPGLVVCVSGGMGETEVAGYLAHPALKIFGAYPVGKLTAISAAPGEFLGKENVEARAADLAGDLARAVREKRRYPATDKDLLFYQFMGDMVASHKKVMAGDYDHWKKHDLFESFESYTKQRYTHVEIPPELKKARMKKIMGNHNKQYKIQGTGDKAKG